MPFFVFVFVFFFLFFFLSFLSLVRWFALFLSLDLVMSIAPFLSSSLISRARDSYSVSRCWSVGLNRLVRTVFGEAFCQSETESRTRQAEPTLLARKSRVYRDAQLNITASFSELEIRVKCEAFKPPVINKKTMLKLFRVSTEDFFLLKSLILTD